MKAGRKIFVATWMATVVAAGSMALAQSGPPNGGQGGPPNAGQGGMRDGPMGRQGQQNMRMNDRLEPMLNKLGRLNLKPDFTLSTDQKEKIAAIEAEFKKKVDAWRETNKVDLKTFQDDMADLRNQGPDADRQAMRDLMQGMRELMDTAPDGVDEVKQVRAVLTKEQASALKEANEADATERDANRPQRPDGAGGPGGQRGPGGPQR